MGDSYEAVERRKKAMAILDAPELLMMYAQERGDVGLLPSSLETMLTI